MTVIGVIQIQNLPAIGTAQTTDVVPVSQNGTVYKSPMSNYAGLPGGTNGQVQYNASGSFGGTTPGPFFSSSDAANLTGTVSTSRFNGGTNAAGSSFLSGAGTWAVPPGTGQAPGGTTGQIQYNNAGTFAGTTPGPFFSSSDAANLTGTVSTSRFNGGTGATSTTFLRGDGVWGVPAGTAQSARWTVSDSVTAAGSNQTGATVLSSNVNTIISGGTSTGVVLQGTSVFAVGDEVNVRNNTSDTQFVYPDGTSAINALTTSAAYSLFPDQGVRLIRVGSAQWRNYP